MRLLKALLCRVTPGRATRQRIDFAASAALHVVFARLRHNLR